MKENNKSYLHSTWHPLKDYPKEVKINFIYIIAIMAGVDGIISGEELDYLDSLCSSLGITESDKDEIMESVRCHPEKLSHIVKTFSSEVKFSLIWGLITMIYADGLLATEELVRLKDISTQLEIKPEQLEFIIELKEKSLKEGNFSDFREKFKRNLAELNIPVEFILF